jgi:hypothetical protein
MKQTITILIGLALAGSALTVSAQQGQGRGAGGPHRYGAQKFPPPIAAVLDKDSNGVLSAAEMAQAPSELLKLDKNNDGQLTADELCPGGFGRGGQQCPWGGQGQGQGRRAGASGQKSLFLAILDTDKDGILGSAEINGAPAALLVLDKNSDGQITAEEIRPLPGCGRGCPWAQNQAK